MFTFNRNRQLDKWLPKTLRRIGEDLRKAGAIAGVGFVGLVLPNDSIEFAEAFALVIFGMLSWVIGLHFEYAADKIETSSNSSNRPEQRNRKSKKRKEGK
ncbi:hypothetical protein [Exercitatus varius]|uniref:hypothetical protein n=1 Tax=Exercitatus varius TaxID=67857 RepID=UPI00294B4045|nr:hypothetical protein [Exercitatus varius]MDG2961728.1 hypothetical protein [Exercitatus varius]